MITPFEDIINRLERIEKLLLEQKPHAIQSIPVTIIDTKELCLLLNITEPTVILWRKRGKIPFMQFGSTVRYNKEAVIKALENDTKRKS